MGLFTQFYLLRFLKEICNVLKRLSGWILSNDTFNLIHFFLYRIESLSVRTTDPCDFQSLCSLQKSLGPVSKLSNDDIPESKTLVAWCTVWKGTRVASGALVTSESLNPFITNASSCGAIALWGLDTTGITVTS